MSFQHTHGFSAWPVADRLRRAGQQALIVLLGAGISFACLLAPAVVSVLASGNPDVPVTVTIASSRAAGLNPADVDALTRALPGTTLARELTSPALATDTQPALAVESVDATFFAAYGLTPLSGALFTPSDDVGARPLAVLGHQAAQTLFGDPSAAVGRTLHVRNVSFSVVGVLAQPDAPELDPSTRTVFIPLQTSRVRLVGMDAPTAVVLGPANSADAANVAAIASQVLALRYRSAPSSFSIQTHVVAQDSVSVVQVVARATQLVRVEFLKAKGRDPSFLQ